LQGSLLWGGYISLANVPDLAGGTNFLSLLIIPCLS
jgi:hypothetical protein